MKARCVPFIVVAGGAGFIGSHIIEAVLADGARVLCIDNFLTGRLRNLEAFKRESRFNLLELDISKSSLERRLRAVKRIDALYNLACAASPPHYQANPEHTMLTCVIGTHQLLKVAESFGARLIQASTSEVYGDPKAHPQSESYWGHVNPIGPRACYDEGKRAAETLIFDFIRKSRIDARVARIFNTYGPRMRHDDGRIVSNAICQALNRDDITVYGDGEQTRSFCYISDLVDGLLRLARHKGEQPGPINLGNPNELKISDLVKLVLQMTGSVSAIASRPLPLDDPQRRRPDISLAKSLLGWTPHVSLEDGLVQTIAYFEQDLEISQRPSQMRRRPAARSESKAPNLAA